MKYQIELANGSQGETVDIVSDDVNELVRKTICQRRQWLLEGMGVKLSITDDRPYKEDKEFVNKIINGLNQKILSQRESLKTILSQFNPTNIFTYTDLLEKNIVFPDAEPVSPPLIQLPEYDSTKYEPEHIKSGMSFLDKMLPGKYDSLLYEAEQDKNSLLQKRNAISKQNEEILHEHAALLEDWKKRRDDFIKKISEHNNQIDSTIQRLNRLDPTIFAQYIQLVLEKIEYPAKFKKKIECDFIEDTRTLIVNYLLPNPDDIPSVKELKPNFTQNNILEKSLAKKEIDDLYDLLIYQICLQSLRYVQKSAIGNTIQAIVFNGWIESIDKATGNEYRACIMSVHASTETLNAINFLRVSPIDCFKSLKGICGAKLANVTPVAPILDINKSDKRFVASKEVIKDVDSGTNLASMDWEDFEHLIREIFEKEFSQNGGEVKITQASRDAGVDAVAFDPDPIRGGKIVIQAKRYTNVVGVSAVRDLYGTLMNEGATKGILVSTSNYGPDAYEFAKGKPITLLTGANLLSLLEKHGVKARIDIREAKEIMAQTI